MLVFCLPLCKALMSHDDRVLSARSGQVVLRTYGKFINEDIQKLKPTLQLQQVVGVNPV